MGGVIPLRTHTGGVIPLRTHTGGVIPLRTHTALVIYFQSKSHLLKYWPTLTSFLGVKEWSYSKFDDICEERATQELFKYQIRFSVASVVSEICAVKETPLFSDFS